jgi:hypothetical protein
MGHVEEGPPLFSDDEEVGQSRSLKKLDIKVADSMIS